MAPVALAFGLLLSGHDAAALGVILACALVPQLLFALLGGVIADRVSRRRLLLATDLCQAVIQAVTGFLFISGNAPLWVLGLLQFLYGSASAWAGPALAGQVADVTFDKQRLQQANSLIGMTRSIGGIAGPALAGILIAVAGAGFAFLFDAFTFVVSALCLSRLPDRLKAADTAKPGLVSNLREGWLEFRRHTWVWVMVADGVVYHLIVAATVQVVGPSIAQQQWSGAATWASLLTARSVGALVMGLLLLGRTVPRGLFFGRLALIAEIPVLVLLINGDSLVLLVIAGVVAGASMTFYSAGWRTSLQLHIPSDRLSRVSSFDWLAAMAFAPVGYTGLGLASEHVGADTVVWDTILIHAMATVAVLLVPAVRRLDNRARADASTST